MCDLGHVSHAQAQCKQRRTPARSMHASTPGACAQARQEHAHKHASFISKAMPGASQKHVSSKPGVCQELARSKPEECQKHARTMPGACREHTASKTEASQEHARSVRRACCEQARSLEEGANESFGIYSFGVFIAFTSQL